MADIFDSLSLGLLKLLGTGRGEVIVSEAPGAGPASTDTGNRIAVEQSHNGRMPLGYLAATPSYGRHGTGFGGHGDAIPVEADDPQAEVKAAVEEAVRIARVHHRLRDVKPSGRYRVNKWMWAEAHSDNTTGPTMGPFSLFDGTIAAPSAGNSVQTVSIGMPTGALSPVFLLDRYPGALFMSLFVSSFAFTPTAATGTGIQECWFSDISGATAGLGNYVASAPTSGIQNINKQLSGPLTDPGINTLGTLTVNNIGIAGTPVTVRYQLSIGYLIIFPDPFFNEQMIVPPTPAQIAQGLRTMEAAG